MDRFVSHSTERLNSQGRVSVQASFRSVLSRDGFEGLYVHPSLSTDTLDCGGHALLREIGALLAPSPPSSEEWGAYASTLHEESEVLKLDGEGRVILSGKLMRHAGIAAEATLAGQGHKSQIWEPGRFRAHLEEARRRVRDHRRLFGFGHAAQNPAPQPPGARD